VDGREVASGEDVAVEEIVEDFGGCVDLLLSVLLLISTTRMTSYGE
jgi:hypothetical protein